ncbi:MFS transporter [Ramlibacter sp.]|uniref:MFS transporter n=1 Tax=Ramlibacter sp. TaxID=1917967 RepID=UPI002604F4D4|nr:MFS transporter [Ramlibacter sp.]MDB5957600.1 transporter [Ramlibacter sp.]
MRAPTSGLALVWRLGAATTLIVTASAMTGPVLAVLLQQAGRGTAFIGAFSMLPFLMVGLLIPLMPRVLARLGTVRCYRAGALLQFTGVLGYALTQRPVLWALCSIVIGCGAAALWNTTEALMAEEAPPEMRGRVMGAYQTALGAALAVGPFLPGLLQLDARPVLWLAVAMVAGCVLLAVTARPHVSKPRDPQAGGTWQALRLVPWLAVLAFCGGVFEAGLGAVSAAHASASGLSLRSAASVAGAIGVGSFLLQYPAGLAADRYPLTRVFTCASLALLVASIAMAFATQAPWLPWACGLVWGGVGGALYTLSMVQVAHTFAGRAAGGGTAAMITGYTWGGSLGPVASGSALQAGGAPGLALLLSLLALAALAAARRALSPP